MNLLKGMQLNFPAEDCRKRGLLRNYIAASIILLAMCSDVHHNFLWGPDEPRDAEISREVLLGNHWVVTRLCNLPFLEKPPLYYDLTALVFKATGIIAPWSARLVPLCHDKKID